MAGLGLHGPACAHPDREPRPLDIHASRARGRVLYGGRDQRPAGARARVSGAHSGEARAQGRGREREEHGGAPGDGRGRVLDGGVHRGGHVGAAGSVVRR